MAGHAQTDTLPPLLSVRDMAGTQLTDMLARYALKLRVLPDGAAIPASYWGEPEAGLKGPVVFARSDTPVHSVLHEACHYVCMTAERRARLDTDAGGGYAEEDAVCYLQIILAGHLEASSCESMCADMDRWGYSFRLGSAAAWFQNDAEDACAWLRDKDLLTDAGTPTWRCRDESATK